MESDAKEEGKVLGYNSKNVKKVALLSTLAALLVDPILADVPKKPSLSDVDTLINLELGSAMCISIFKLDGTFFDVAVMNSATVKDLKLAIKKKVIELEQSKMGHRHISWFIILFLLLNHPHFFFLARTTLTLIGGILMYYREKKKAERLKFFFSFNVYFVCGYKRHVWANFCLAHHNEKLLDDGAALQDFGVRNNSQVHFLPYVVSKGSGRHSKRRKHRFLHGLNKHS